MEPSRRVWLITGASSGIGAALARRIAGKGTGLVIHARHSAERLEAIAMEVHAAGSQVVTVLGDLAEPRTAVAVVDAARETFGSLDVLVANAGFPIAKPAEAVTTDDLDYAFRGNAISFLALAQAAHGMLRHAAHPRIIATGSFTAHLFRNDLPQFPASVAAKGAIEVAVRSLALAYAPDRITVNCVVPGYIAKDPGIAGNVDPARLAAIAERIPLGRLGRPREVADLIAFLASDAADYITGQSMHINGGLT
ncbi:MAG TPA: SDR family oxidoreductase [Rhabdaerophilum sp.]|nr:SDR family oxidoreductase [Rhabdaerophilum sp.]